MTKNHPPLPSRAKLDVVGMGAINIDYIARYEHLGWTPPAEKTAENPEDSDFEWGTESRVSEAVISRMLQSSAPGNFSVSPGGSAFYTMSVLAHIDRGLRLGFVGISGRAPLRSLSGFAEAQRLGLDTRYMSRSDKTSGVCLSYLHKGERVLLTNPGANLALAEYLAANRSDVVDYLGTATIVHVTSVYGAESTHEVHEILRELRDRHSQVYLSVDPGHLWASDPTDDVRGIIELCDLIMVTSRECRDLVQADDADGIVSVADRVLATMKQPHATVLVKRAHDITVVQRTSHGISVETYNHEPLPDAEIADATNAGDAFAAGVLAEVIDQSTESAPCPTADSLNLEHGIIFGMDLAKHKIRHLGMDGNSGYVSVARAHRHPYVVD